LELVEDSIDIDSDDGSGQIYSAPAKQLIDSWSSSLAFVDATELDVASTASAPLQRLFDSFRQAGASAIPVVRLGCSPAFAQAAAHTIATDQRGCAVRLTVDELVDSGVGASLVQLLNSLGIQAKDVDLILDWGPLDIGRAARAYHEVVTVLPTIPTLPDWRAVVFVGSSFPSTLSGVG